MTLDQILQQVIGYGPAGLIIAYLLWQNRDLGNLLTKVNEDRLKEKERCIEALNGVTTALNNHSKGLEAQTRAIEAMAARRPAR